MLLLMAFQATLCNNNNRSKIVHTKFQPYATEQFLYTKTTQVDQENYEGLFTDKVISDVTFASCFTTGITRQLITQELDNNDIVTVTQTWTTKNPSYATWTLMFCAITAISVPMIIALCNQEYCIMSASDYMTTYLLTDKRYKAKFIANLADKAINQGLISEQDVIAATGTLGLQKLKNFTKSL